MGKLFSVRLISIAVIAVAMSIVVAGCGSDNKTGSAGSQSGPGATNGATGTAAGGAAVEAGKQRDPQDVETEKKNFSKEPPPVQIDSGNASGIHVKKPTVYIVQSNKELKALRKKQFSKGVPSETWASTDFGTRQFVYVVLPESQKGSLLAITDIYQDGGTITVKAVHLLSGKGCKASGSKPRPWQVVETRKMTGTPAAKITDQASSPC